LVIGAVVLGIVVMHSVVFGNRPTMNVLPHAVVAEVGVADSPAEHLSHDVMRLAAPAPIAVGDSPGCDGCAMAGHFMHLCIFVLTALALALGLTLLAWTGAAWRDLLLQAIRRLLFRRARPPPWTVPSLAELAILRI
jgi:hypothetical protein